MTSANPLMTKEKLSARSVHDYVIADLSASCRRAITAQHSHSIDIDENLLVTDGIRETAA
jgi:hypothetical protein